MKRAHRLSPVLIVAKENYPYARDLAAKLEKMLEEAGFETHTLAPLAIPSVKQLRSSLEASKTGIKLIVAVGGDGTLLRTLRTFRDETPILGVNVGGRGALAEVLPNDLQDAAAKISGGKYYLDRRLRMIARVKGRLLPPACNEIYIVRSVLNRTPTYVIRSPGKWEFKQRMDGVVVTVPTGSTGHSLSLGGPVISEELEAFVLTPIGAVNRFPPLVLPPRDLEIESSDSVQLVVDGQETFDVESNVKIALQTFGKRAVFLRTRNRILGQLSNLGY